jgi:hypothetical protein
MFVVCWKWMQDFGAGRTDSAFKWGSRHVVHAAGRWVGCHGESSVSKDTLTQSIFHFAAGWCNIGVEAVFHNNVSVPCTNVLGSGASGLHCGFGTAALAAGLMAFNMAV